MRTGLSPGESIKVYKPCQIMEITVDDNDLNFLKSWSYDFNNSTWLLIVAHQGVPYDLLFLGGLQKQEYRDAILGKQHP